MAITLILTMAYLHPLATVAYFPHSLLIERAIEVRRPQIKEPSHACVVNRDIAWLEQLSLLISSLSCIPVDVFDDRVPVYSSGI